jgi:hypothetical protein
MAGYGAPISGLPEIGNICAKVGYSRLWISGLPEIGNICAKSATADLGDVHWPPDIGRERPPRSTLADAEA